jgi:hypothetical protein
VQQRLRWNAADVEAGAAEGLVLLDQRRLESKLRGPDRADIAARAGADDNEIVDRVCHLIVLGDAFASPHAEKHVDKHGDRDKPDHRL